ncbi:Fur family transcriptional regulator [Geoalkalibacter sp.]|uniref:Fur family transcriptional regulator n=1 Tax=Geoalkalibacter sp. TaxID=3041440 RepID=UPI00272E1032|nr:transcriptional repressor [Geoalkalibacter sp.]
MTDTASRLDQILTKLRALDCRITPQRLAVLRILLESPGHPTMEEIYAQVRRDFPTVSLATIYKTATLLKGLGEVLEVGMRHGSSRYDAHKPYPHPHVICTHCKAILDFEELPLAELTQAIAEKTGFEIRDHQLEFFGLCPACREGGSPT